VNLVSLLLYFPKDRHCTSPALVLGLQLQFPLTHPSSWKSLLLLDHDKSSINLAFHISLAEYVGTMEMHKTGILEELSVLHQYL
jgi:hypothetical protein